MSPIRILVADDHTLLREALCELLAAEPDLDVVAQAGTGPATLALAAEHRPDVLLLDLEMPGSDPPDTVRRLLAQDPALRVIVLSMHDGGHLVRQLLSLGVRGYLHKGTGRHTLTAAIRQSVDDHAPAVTLSVSPSSLLTTPEDPLSTREHEILTLVAEARNNRQIATALGITEATVKRHLRNIFAKLEAVSRLDAVNRAIELSLLPARGRDQR
ncbi:response regulator transcription factor [Nocardia sp. SSK8]|uniref:response regulator transcription factor n=1 Tax=Nocardia sp. SSK8 TaxID=3120154 RepID=UPI0030099CA9